MQICGSASQNRTQAAFCGIHDKIWRDLSWKQSDFAPVGRSFGLAHLLHNASRMPVRHDNRVDGNKNDA